MQIKNGTFYSGDQPLFYLADTCWSAFTDILESDWAYYLDYRKMQGFNVIQVNLLEQWDASKSVLDIQPFIKKTDGTFDFEQLNEAYFDRVERMMLLAREKGFTIALVLLWVNYLPDTWATKLLATSQFPKEKVADYVDYVMARYDKFEPIYLISGDTDFPSDEVIAYYKIALDRIKKNNPLALKTFHIRGREKGLPDVFESHDDLDFYMFQSGHNHKFQDMPYRLAEIFYQKEPKRLAINAEPCYEMMGYSGKVYGRFSREDVRRAAWESVLSGAGSGITYGAHGIYSWHVSELGFNSDIGEAFDTPFDWHDALQFEGAWDYAFLKQFIEREKLFSLTPCQSVIGNDSEAIRASETIAQMIVYIPYNVQVILNGNYASCEMVYLDLESKKQMATSGQYDASTRVTKVPMHRFVRDVLLIIKKK